MYAVPILRGVSGRWFYVWLLFMSLVFFALSGAFGTAWDAKV